MEIMLGTLKPVGNMFSRIHSQMFSWYQLENYSKKTICKRLVRRALLFCLVALRLDLAR